MKVKCWEDLEGFKYIKDKGTFRRGAHTYFMKNCKHCGYEFFGYKNSLYCNNICSSKDDNSGMKNKKHSKNTINKLKRKWLNKDSIYNSEAYRKKLKNKSESNGNWKGGITQKDYVLCNTYSNQLELYEKTRNDNGVLEVVCIYCGKWYKPNRNEVSNRLQFLKSNKKYHGEFNFYCSDKCKSECYIYKLSERDLLSRINKDSYSLYKSLVYKYTRKNYKRFQKIVNPNNLSIGRNKYHLDHKYSILEGFNHCILPHIVGSYVNLEILGEKYNINKGPKCSISLKELYKVYNIEATNGNNWFQY